MHHPASRCALLLAVIPLFALPPLLFAEDFDGVQPAALDQPRVNLVVRRTAKGPVLFGKAGAAAQLMGDTATYNVEAFLDTGASSVLLSLNTANALGIKHEIVGAAPGAREVRFEDVGVGGGSEFAVSEPIILSIAPEAPNVDIDQKDAIPTTYTQTVGPLRTEIGPLDLSGGLLAELTMGDLDVAGTPVMQGKVVVMDTKDVNNFSDKIRTYLYDPGATASAGGPGIPKVSRHVQLSYAWFAPYTKTIPPTADPPAMAPNPIIGPDPLQPQGDKTPPILAAHNGKTIAGSWLLDTGAAASMISRKQAAALGVTYVPSTYGTANPRLNGVPANKQFSLPIGGIGGSKTSAGFYLDKLTLQTTEGKTITYLHAPVLVADITVQDPRTGKQFTLDGVFGMNFLVASANVTTNALMPDIGAMTAGPWKWIVFDQPNALLGLE